MRCTGIRVEPRETYTTGSRLAAARAKPQRSMIADKSYALLWNVETRALENLSSRLSPEQQWPQAEWPHKESAGCSGKPGGIN